MGLWEVQEKFDSRLPVHKPILFVTKDEIDFSNGSTRTSDLLITDEKPFDLMANIPLEADETEDLMNQ